MNFLESYIKNKLLIKENFDFLEKHGIKPQKAQSSHQACSIGYSEKENKWYGWSHRAYHGFSIGDVIKEGDIVVGCLPVGFKSKTIQDCEKMARCFAKNVS